MPLITIRHIHYHRHPEIEVMNALLERLRQEVADNTAADQSAITLIRGLVARVEELVANTTELEELRTGLSQLTTDLSDSTDALGAAVAENTPAEPAPAEPAPVDPAPVDPAPVDPTQP